MKVTYEQMPTFVADFLKTIEPREHAYVIALSGNLGAGKTTFSQELAKQLGVTESVASPTFVIMKQYALTNQRFERLVHIDAYRLESAEELQTLHIESVLSDKDTIVLLEWPEHVQDCIPGDATTISISVIDDTSRDITISHA